MKMKKKVLIGIIIVLVLAIISYSFIVTPSPPQLSRDFMDPRGACSPEQNQVDIGECQNIHTLCRDGCSWIRLGCKLSCDRDASACYRAVGDRIALCQRYISTVE
jgi:hypothetical protein